MLRLFRLFALAHCRYPVVPFGLNAPVNENITLVVVLKLVAVLAGQELLIKLARRQVARSRKW